MYEEMHLIETTHWWFKSKREIVDTLITQIIKNKVINNITLVDFGCGCGAMVENLQQYGNAVGIDCSDIALSFCKEHFNGELIKLNLEDEIDDNIKRQFNIGVALDVLEHIDNDLMAAKNINTMLNKENGTCIITVPAYQWLWTNHDVNCMHKRRYNKKQLKELLEKAGFNIQYISYYNFYLFLPAALIRLISKLFNLDKNSKLENKNNDSFLNKLLYNIFSSEKNHIKKYKTFPFGLSLIAVVTPTL